MCMKSGSVGNEAQDGQTSQTAFMHNYLMKSSQVFADQSYITCPVGLLLLLSTLFGSGGTRGNTGAQIAQTLRLKSKFCQNNLEAAARESQILYKELVDDLTSEETFINDRRINVLTIASGVFVKRDYEIKPNFLWSLKNEFQTTVQQLDFYNQSESARQINIWVNRETRGLIPRLFQSPTELPADTKLAVFNTFTFKDHWFNPFNVYATKMEEFYSSETKSFRMPMMSIVEVLPYANMPNRGFAILKKPLKNYRFSFVVVLPHEKWNLNAVDHVLNGRLSIEQLSKEMDDHAVSLKLPKFKLQKTLNLIPVLESMGVVDLFRQHMANLTGVVSHERLFVNFLKQSTILKLDESGVEAAAVTGAVAVPTSLVQASVEFHVNHPFVCFIYDEQLQIPLVAVRVTQPELI